MPDATNPPRTLLDARRPTGASTGTNGSAASTDAKALAARHTRAAEELAARGDWQRAYEDLRAAVRVLHGLHPIDGAPVRPDELDRLRREHAEARELSRRDSLTASYNRRYLDERLAALIDGHPPAGVSLALVDVDHFKTVNDTYGHPFGDRVLQGLVTELHAGLPDSAFCARYGGEEFALVLPEHDLNEAVRVCEATRDRVQAGTWPGLGVPLRVTVSIGVAHSAGRTAEVERLVGEADLLLYAAKQAGRNAVAYRASRTGRVVLAGSAACRRSIPQPVRTTG